MRFSPPVSLLLIVLLYSLFLSAQTSFSIAWNMQQPAPSNSSSTLIVASDIAQGVNYGTTLFLSSHSSSLNAYAGASGENNAALSCRTGPLVKTAVGSSYFSFTISAASGYKFLLQSIAVGMRSTLTGPQSWSIFSSADSFNSPIFTGAILNNSGWILQEHALHTAYQHVVEYRIYGFDGVGASAINVANWRIDDLQISGMVTPVALPVQWLYTKLETVNNTVLVEWATAREENNLRYSIERSSNGVTFLKIGEVDACSNSIVTERKDYQFRDNAPLQGRSYYRIVQEDIDGALNFSLIKSIDRIDAVSFSIIHYRVDLASRSLQVFCKGNGQTVFQLYNLAGQLLTQQSEVFTQGQTRPVAISLPMSLKKGSFLLMVVHYENRRAFFRFIINN
jgi:hypothetical protein